MKHLNSKRLAGSLQPYAMCLWESQFEFLTYVMFCLGIMFTEHGEKLISIICLKNFNRMNTESRLHNLPSEAWHVIRAMWGRRCSGARSRLRRHSIGAALVRSLEQDSAVWTTPQPGESTMQPPPPMVTCSTGSFRTTPPWLLLRLAHR